MIVDRSLSNCEGGAVSNPPSLVRTVVSVNDLAQALGTRVIFQANLNLVEFLKA